MPSFSAIFTPSSGLLRPEKIMSRLRGDVTWQELSATVRLSFRVGRRPTVDCIKGRCGAPLAAVPVPANERCACELLGAVLLLLAQPPCGATLGVAFDVRLLVAGDAQGAGRHVAGDHRAGGRE